jgi:hypothetical protein
MRARVCAGCGAPKGQIRWYQKDYLKIFIDPKLQYTLTKCNGKGKIGLCTRCRIRVMGRKNLVIHHENYIYKKREVTKPV